MRKLATWLGRSIRSGGRHLAARVAAVRAWPRFGSDAGMNTAEYAVGTLAAVAFAGILLKVLTSDKVQAALTAIVNRALK